MTRTANQQTTNQPSAKGYEAIVLGVSAGGLDALSRLLPELPADFALSLIVVQHIAPSSDNFWVQLLNDKTNLAVKEADEKEAIEKGCVYFAPPGYHLLVEQDRTFGLSVDKRVNHSRPAIDVLFESAAEAYRDGLAGVVLTGANHDGAQGLKRIKQIGGLTIVQDPADAESSAMPRAAIQAARPDHVLSLADIGPLLTSLPAREGAVA